MPQTLIDRIRAGDEDAVADLAAAHSARIYRVAFRYLRNREDAEEVVQDVLLRITRRADTFRGDAALSTWIHRIAFNATMTRVRRARPGHHDVRSHDSRSLDIIDRAPRPDTRAYRSQLRRRLRRAILDLPAAYRAPVVLRDLHGLSSAQAGAALAIKAGTLKSRLHRGHLMLRDRLSGYSTTPVARRRLDTTVSNEAG